MNDNNLKESVRIMHVQGNVLRLAIPLEVITASVVNGVAEKTKEDFVPTNPVTVVLTCGNFSIKRPATMEGNVALVEFLESLKLGVYSVTVYTKDDDGNPMRFKQRTAIEVVDATADAGITPGEEFDSEAYWLDGAIYLGPIGGSIDTSGLAQIDERTNQVKYSQVSTDILDDIELPNHSVTVDGSMIYGNESGHIIKVTGTETGFVSIDLGIAPQMVFLNKEDNCFYQWTGSAWQQVGDSSYEVVDPGARQLIASLQAALDALTSGDTTTAIKTFNEIIAFLDNIEDTTTLQGIIAGLQTSISGKVDKVTGKGLSTNDFTDALLAKLNGIAAGAQVNVINGIQTHDGQSLTPNNGIVTLPEQTGLDPDDYYDKDEVDALVEGIPAGPQGPKGDTVVVSTEGLEQFDLANELDSSSTTDGLTARQGKVLKQAIMTVAANLQAVYNALAGVAFVELPKPSLTTIDWTGGTFYATINKSLTGCTATDNTTNGQIAEGSTLTVTLSASSGYTLDGATISVSNSKGQSVAYTMNGNVMTISNVVGTINISVVAVAVASVTNSDSHVDLTSQTLAPIIGSSWTGTLAIKSGVSNYRIAPSPTITMDGVAVDFTASGNSWDSTTGVIVIGNVTGDIVIVSASIEIVAVQVRNHFINVNSSNSASQVEQGDAYNTILSPIADATSNNDLRVFVGGELMTVDTDYTFDSATGALSIPAAKITGDIDVCATASTGKITVTVKAGMSTTLKLYRDAWAAAFFDDTIDATNSAVDVTVVIDNVPTYAYNGKNLHTVSIWTIGDRAAIKSIDFGGCRTRGYGNMSGLSGFTNAESITGLAYVEAPNNGAVTIGGMFINDSSLQHGLDLMTWKCDTQNNTLKMLDGTVTDTVILPYLPSLTSTYGLLLNSSVKKLIFNKTGIITSFRNMLTSASQIEFVDMSLATVQLVAGQFTWYVVTDNSTRNGFTLKIGEFDVSGAPNSGGLSKVGKLICTTTTPPHSELLNCLSSSVLIYVPNNAVNTYKTAWSAMANNIHPVSEYTE